MTSSVLDVFRGLELFAGRRPALDGDDAHTDLLNSQLSSKYQTLAVVS